jgi:hypothetical protein
MIYMWFTGINYYKLAVEKDRDFKKVACISNFAIKLNEKELWRRQ